MEPSEGNREWRVEESNGESVRKGAEGMPNGIAGKTICSVTELSATHFVGGRCPVGQNCSDGSPCSRYTVKDND